VNEYIPWSQEELNRSLELYELGVFSILDIELGGASLVIG